MNPDERVPGLSGVIEDLAKLPPGIELPSGVEKNNKWYAQFYTTNDGRTFYEFYRRGNTGKPGTETPDPVYATVQGPPNTVQADKWKKDSESAGGRPQTVIGDDGKPYNVTTRPGANGGPPTTVVTDADGNPVPGNVVPGKAASEKPSSQVPGNATPRIEGTPTGTDANGNPTFDNNQPIMVWRTPDGRQVDARPLNEGERARWEREQGRAPAEDAKPRQVTGSDGRIYSVVTKPGPNGAPVTEVYGPDGTLVPGGVVPGTAKPAEADDKVGKPTGATRQGKDAEGRTVPEKEYALPDGTTVWRADAAGAKPTTGRKEVDVKGYPGWKHITEVDDAKGTERQYYLNPQGQEAPLPDANGYAPEPGGAPPMAYTVGQMTAGLQAYSQWLDGQVKLYAETGGKQGVSSDQATKLMTRRVALAESAMKEQEGLGNLQASQRRDDINQRRDSLNETQSRRNTAASIVTNAQSTLLPLARYAGRGKGGLAVDAINAWLGRSRGYIDSFGGMQEHPEIAPGQFPVLNELRGASMAGMQPVQRSGPGMFDPQARPPMQEAPPPAVPAVNPVSETPITLPGQTVPRPEPAFRPPPPMGPDPMAPERPFSENLPTGMLPPSRFMQETRYGVGNYYDPVQRGTALAERLGIPPDILKQALGSLYS